MDIIDAITSTPIYIVTRMSNTLHYVTTLQYIVDSPLPARFRIFGRGVTADLKLIHVILQYGCYRYLTKLYPYDLAVARKTLFYKNLPSFNIGSTEKS